MPTTAAAPIPAVRACVGNCAVGEGDPSSRATNGQKGPDCCPPPAQQSPRMLTLLVRDLRRAPRRFRTGENHGRVGYASVHFGAVERGACIPDRCKPMSPATTRAFRIHGRRVGDGASPRNRKLHGGPCGQLALRGVRQTEHHEGVFLPAERAQDPRGTGGGCARWLGCRARSVTGPPLD